MVPLILTFKENVSVVSYNVNGISTKMDKLLTRIVFAPHNPPPDMLMFQELRVNVPCYTIFCHKLHMYCS